MRQAQRQYFGYSGSFWGLSPRRGDALHRLGWNSAKFTPSVQEWDCGPLKTEQFYAISEFKRILRKFQGVCGASVSVIYNLGRFTLWVSDLWGFKIMSVFPLNFQRPSAIYETIRRMRTRFKGASHVNVDHESTLTCLMWPPRLRGWYRSLMIIEKIVKFAVFGPVGATVFTNRTVFTRWVHCLVPNLALIGEMWIKEPLNLKIW